MTAPNSIEGRRCESKDEMTQPGDFYWSGFVLGRVGRLMFICPCGCGNMNGAPLKPGRDDGWEWNRDLDKPTLKPSLDFSRTCGWHGWLTDGIFTTQ